MREATKTPATPLKGLQVSAVEMDDTVHHQWRLYGRKPLWIIARIKFQLESPTLDNSLPSERSFFGLMKA